MSAPDHVAIVEPDERGRFHLRKFLGKDPGARYKVFVNQEQGSLTLQRVSDIE